MQIKGKLSIKRRYQKYLIFWSPKESSYGWERRKRKEEEKRRRRREDKRKGREEERKKREEEEPKRFGILKFCMDFHGIVWIVACP